MLEANYSDFRKKFYFIEMLYMDMKQELLRLEIVVSNVINMNSTLFKLLSTLDVRNVNTKQKIKEA